VGGDGGFGAVLRTCRLSAGLSQEELAGRSGLSIRTISNLEGGRIRWPHPGSVRRLADALGLSGSQRQQFIAEAGRRLARAAAGPVTAAPEDPRPGTDRGNVVPRQLPAPARHFVGREAELAELGGLLDRAGAGGSPAVVISAIGGTAGVGKTALAVHWAHQVADRFPDGQLYVNLRGFDPTGSPLPAATAVRAFLEALGVAPERIPASLDARAALYRSLVAGQRMLVVLDNARDAEQVRALLPGSPGCFVVVTSRSQLTGLVAVEGAHALTLDLLTDAEARTLLTARLGAARVDAEFGAAAELARLCARLPLALVIAAARVAASPQLRLGAFAEELADARSRLDLLDSGDAPTSVRAVFSWSVGSLPPPAARMFGLLGLHPGRDITAHAAASLAGVPLRQARTALRQLAGASLTTEHSSGRYSLHDLLRAYVAELAGAADGQDGHHEATRRMLDYYLHTAHAAGRVICPRRRHVRLDAARPHCAPLEFGDYDAALRWLKSEHANLVAAVTHAAEQGEHDIAWKLPIELWDLFSMGYHWPDWISSVETGLVSARELGDQAAQAWLLNHLAIARQRSGDTEEAFAAFREALEIRRLTGDRHGAAVVLANLGRTLSEACRLAEALQCLQEALQVFTQAENLAEQGRCMYLLSATYRRLGRIENAIASADQAVRTFRQIGDEVEESTALVQLALAAVRVGDPASAVAHAARAAELAQSRGDQVDQAEALAALGRAFLASGQSEQARKALRTARRIFTDIGYANTDEWLKAPP
jgi:tetratricopeptide (TPR) repeat protein/transcriptional regulator with XRE-family HTH domain